MSSNSLKTKKRYLLQREQKQHSGEFEEFRKAKQTKITYDIIQAQIFSFLLPAFTLHLDMHIISAVVICNFLSFFQICHTISSHLRMLLTGLPNYHL